MLNAGGLLSLPLFLLFLGFRLRQVQLIDVLKDLLESVDKGRVLFQRVHGVLEAESPGVVDEEYIRVGRHVNSAQEDSLLRVLVLDDFGYAAQIKVLESALLPELAMQLLWELDGV